MLKAALITSLLVAILLVAGSSARGGNDYAVVDCTSNTSTFNYSTDTLTISGAMAGCPRGTLTISADAWVEYDNGYSQPIRYVPPVTCYAATSCKFASVSQQVCCSSVTIFVGVKGTFPGGSNDVVKSWWRP
jgi:hypothetical protein